MSTQSEPAAFRDRSELPTCGAVITPIGTAYSLSRRLRLALHELGVLKHISSEWLQPGPEGLSFASLSVREADQLVLAIEDLVQRFPASQSSVSPQQVQLF